MLFRSTLRDQVEQNQHLLLSILPDSAASRFQQGTKAMAEDHAYVSVLFARIEGWEEFSQSLPPEEAMRLLKELTGSLEATGERLGMEKLQTVGTTYLAVNGLARPGSDHEQQTVAAAVAMQKVMGSFNQAHQANLLLEIEIGRAHV